VRLVDVVGFQGCSLAVAKIIFQGCSLAVCQDNMRKSAREDSYHGQPLATVGVFLTCDHLCLLFVVGLGRTRLLHTAMCQSCSRQKVMLAQKTVGTPLLLMLGRVPWLTYF